MACVLNVIINMTTLGMRENDLQPRQNQKGGSNDTTRTFNLV